jgi:hypothetical protein
MWFVPSISNQLLDIFQFLCILKNTKYVGTFFETGCFSLQAIIGWKVLVVFVLCTWEQLISLFQAGNLCVFIRTTGLQYIVAIWTWFVFTKTWVQTGLEPGILTDVFHIFFRISIRMSRCDVKQYQNLFLAHPFQFIYHSLSSYCFMPCKLRCWHCL